MIDVADDTRSDFTEFDQIDPFVDLHRALPRYQTNSIQKAVSAMAHSRDHENLATYAVTITTSCHYRDDQYLPSFLTLAGSKLNQKIIGRGYRFRPIGHQLLIVGSVEPKLTNDHLHLLVGIPQGTRVPSQYQSFEEAIYTILHRLCFGCDPGDHQIAALELARQELIASRRADRTVTSNTSLVTVGAQVVYDALATSDRYPNVRRPKHLTLNLCKNLIVLNEDEIANQFGSGRRRRIPKADILVEACDAGWIEYVLKNIRAGAPTWVEDPTRYRWRGADWVISGTLPVATDDYSGLVGG